MFPCCLIVCFISFFLLSDSALPPWGASGPQAAQGGTRGVPGGAGELRRGPGSFGERWRALESSEPGGACRDQVAVAATRLGAPEHTAEVAGAAAILRELGRAADMSTELDRLEDALGVAEVDTSRLLLGGVRDLWLPLTGVANGAVRVRIAPYSASIAPLGPLPPGMTADLLLDDGSRRAVRSESVDKERDTPGAANGRATMDAVLHEPSGPLPTLGAFASLKLRLQTRRSNHFCLTSY